MSTNSPFLAESCALSSHGGRVGYVIKSSLTGVSCGKDRQCQASECCDLMTCSLNNGASAGITGAAFTQTNCEDSNLNGTSSHSLKSDLDKIVCDNGIYPYCTALDCCSDINCGNNDGKSDGASNITQFAAASCPVGYAIKSSS